MSIYINNEAYRRFGIPCRLVACDNAVSVFLPLTRGLSYELNTLCKFEGTLRDTEGVCPECVLILLAARFVAGGEVGGKE